MTADAGRLTVATVNFQDGGWSAERGDYQRLELLPDLIGQAGPVDILCLQEGRAFRADGQALRFRAEQLLAGSGLRRFVTRSQRGPLDEIVFLRCPPLQPARHYTPDPPDVYHDQIGFIHARLPGLPGVLKIKSIHWACWNGDIRLSS